MNQVPPHDLTTERALLACVLHDNRAIDEVVDVLEPSDFYGRANALVFGAMVALHRRTDPIDLVTIRGRLVDRGELAHAGGDEGLVALTDEIPNLESLESLEAYARRVRGLSGVRKVIKAAHKIAAAGYARPEDVDAFLVESEAAIAAAVRSRTVSGGPVPLSQCVDEALAPLFDDRQRPRAVPTRFERLDRLLGGGLAPGQLILVAGRPGMGKTALGLNIALRLSEHGPGIVYSLEMSRDELVYRALASEGRVDGSRIRQGRLSRDDWPRVTKAAKWLGKQASDIDHTGAASLSHIRATARRKRARDGLSWLVIDYLQLMDVPGRAHREKEIGDISRGLKALAKELDAPVIALSQLNREIEKRPAKDRRPQLSDLRDSGSLEQDADVVAFIHREELYQRDAPELRGKAELIIRKQRSGPTGTVHLRYSGEYTRFEELDDDERDAPTDRRDWQDVYD